MAGVFAMAQRDTAGQALRPARGGAVLIEIADQAAQLKSKLEAAGADREAVSLVKDYGLNVMLMVLKPGARLHEHRTKGPLTVQVISGRVSLDAAGKVHQIASGMIIALDREVPHSVEALEDSALLLTTAIN
jgi:quercetin dioxygenase-like cupin family protein